MHGLSTLNVWRNKKAAQLGGRAAVYCPMVSLLSPSRDRVASRNSLSQKTVRCLKKLPRNTGPWKVQRGSLAAKGRIRSCDGHRIVVAAAEIRGTCCYLMQLEPPKSRSDAREKILRQQSETKS